MNLQQNYSINEEMAWQEINGQILILDSHVNESAHELNEMGSFIFQKIKEGVSPKDILSDLVATYSSEANEDEITKDFEGYLSELLELKLILPASNERS